MIYRIIYVFLCVLSLNHKIYLLSHKYINYYTRSHINEKKGKKNKNHLIDIVL